MTNKILVLLPDGIGLRNFAYTDFYKVGQESGHSICFWNNTPFELETLGLNSIKLGGRTHPVTEIYKNARKHIELSLSIERTGDKVYNSYRFPFSYKSTKEALKSLLVQLLILRYSSADGLLKIRTKIMQTERKTDYFRRCVDTLKAEKPSMVFCTNQRPMSAIAPIEAAKELGIPTASFIFSWDNLPKATMVIETDFYFVWSDHMKQELLAYYPYIAEDQIFVTGTPQFEPHTQRSMLMSRDSFFEKYQLDISKKYICYSGDDITTSPNDQLYLRDVANAVRTLNSRGHSLGIIFRRCPVDLSDRYDEVLKENADLIVAIDPLWKPCGEMWNSILPTPDDLELQMNTIKHTELVINLGSSMVFDYVSFGKPCAYINYDYNVPDTSRITFPVKKIYDFVHFRSMPSKDCVGWLNSADTISGVIEDLLTNNSHIINNAKIWFETINRHRAQNASERIIAAIDTIVENSDSTTEPVSAAQV
ncbi:MAG TPA: UDP-glycosyltransferase [Flavobacterium sp.]